MRHGDKVNNLSRTASHRRALLANLANALIQHKRITTTLAKAKASREEVVRVRLTYKDLQEARRTFPVMLDRDRFLVR